MWTRRAQYLDPASSNNQQAEVWYAINSSGNPITDNIVITFDNPVDDQGTVVSSYVGCNLDTPWTASGPFYSNSTDPSTNSATITMSIAEPHSAGIVFFGVPWYQENADGSFGTGFAVNWSNVAEADNGGAVLWEYDELSYRQFTLPQTDLVVTSKYSGTGTQYSLGLTVIADALVGNGGTSNWTINNGLAFPDGTLQTTAWNGSIPTRWDAVPVEAGCPIYTELTSDHFFAYTQNSHLALENAGDWNLGSNSNGTYIFAVGNTTTIYSNIGDVVISLNNSQSNFIFGLDGNLTIPGNLVIAGNTNVFGTDSALIQPTDDKPLIAISSGANGAVSSVWVEDIGNVGISNIAAVYANPTVGSKIVRIAVGQNGGGAGPNLWDFGTDATLTLPNGTTIGSAGFTAPLQTDFLINTFIDNTGDPGTKTWTFGTDGTTQLPDSSIIRTQNWGAFSLKSDNADIVIMTDVDNSRGWTFGADGNLTLPAGGEIHSATGTGNVVVQSNDGATAYNWTFETNGNLTFPDTTTQSTAYKRTTGSWTVATGSGTYSFTVPLNGTYTMWVRGNIDNGIVVWNATATVTNNNVPVIGSQRAWNYTDGGSTILITSIPSQILDEQATISTTMPIGIGTTSNRFDFVINNTSGSAQIVYWGYVTQ